MAKIDTVESAVSLPDPYCEVPLDCPGYTCNLRVSVMACLFAAWSEVRGAARRCMGALPRPASLGT